MKISTVLDQIDMGSIALPEFQRGYVWNRDQVRKLMRSLYRGYPIGSLLIWETDTDNVAVRGDGPVVKGTVKLLLDGQQRITSLYGIIRGKSPKFFDGNEQAFTNLWFNLVDEEFEFFAPLKMQDNPLWVDVTRLMQDDGFGEYMRRLISIPEIQPQVAEYMARLNAINNIKNIELPAQTVTGPDKTVDIVVDIFNEVNSGGTKLSKGDLALARICAAWPEARDEMKIRLNKWSSAGFNFKLDWYMRCITTLVTGQAYFAGLSDIDIPTFYEGLKRAESNIDNILNLIASRLGLDHDRVLGSRYSIPLLVRFLELHDARLPDPKTRDKLLYWYIHTFMWGRYAGSTESVLAQDLATLEEENSLDRLIQNLRQSRGNLTIYPQDFEGWNQGARFYPVMYMLTRVDHARDWDTDIELTNHLLGRLSKLQVHHIFPKALLYKYDYSRQEVNALANFTFLTQETNLLVSDRDPLEYLPVFADKHPGVLESHWIPMDEQLWRVENYLDFLAARRELLASAINKFLQGLLTGIAPEEVVSRSVFEKTVQVFGSIDNEQEEELLLSVMEWIDNLGLAEGEFQYEIVDEATKEPLAILDLAWPNGLQEGRSKPVAILINEGENTKDIAQKNGFKYFTDLDDFRKYVEMDILGVQTAVPEL